MEDRRKENAELNRIYEEIARLLPREGKEQAVDTMKLLAEMYDLDDSPEGRRNAFKVFKRK